MDWWLGGFIVFTTLILLLCAVLLDWGTKQVDDLQRRDIEHLERLREARKSDGNQESG